MKGYRRAEQILPAEVVELIQGYIDGECIYIPRKKGKRKTWGEETRIRQELQSRNNDICTDYAAGLSTKALAEKYCLSVKSIQRIIKERKTYLQCVRTVKEP